MSTAADIAALRRLSITSPAVTDVGRYVVQTEHVRGEPVYRTLFFTAHGEPFAVDLGDARPQHQANWKRAGTLPEIRALAIEHYRKQTRSGATRCDQRKLARIERDDARRVMSDVLVDEAWMWGDGE